MYTNRPLHICVIIRPHQLCWGDGGDGEGGAVVLCFQVAGLICVMDSDLCHDVSGIGVGMVPLCVTTDQLLLRIIPLLLSFIGISAA